MASNITMEQLYKSRNVLLQYLNIQKYNIKDHTKISIGELNTMKDNGQLDMTLTRKLENDEIETVHVKYALDKGLKPKTVTELYDSLNMQSMEKSTLILVLNQDINDTMKDTLMRIWENEQKFVITFTISELQFNLFDHILVPKHNILNQSEEIALLNKLRINRDNLPSISRFDPPIKALGIRPGRICHIIRASKTAIETSYYRLVLNKIP